MCTLDLLYLYLLCIKMGTAVFVLAQEFTKEYIMLVSMGGIYFKYKEEYLHFLK